jgi:hypothetical protein
MSNSPNNTPAFDPAGYNSTEPTARYLDVSVGWLNKSRLDASGPPFVRFGSSVKYYGPSVIAWAAAQTRRSTSDNGEAA